ncbi:hypothetical protein FF1_001667 [Malus domestica]
MSTAEDESVAAQVLKEMMEKLDAVKQGQISYPQITLAPDVSSPLFNWQDQDPVPPNTTAPGSAPHLPPTTPPVVTSPQIGQPTSSSATADRPVSSTSQFPVSMYGIPVNNPTESQVTPTPPAANPSQSVLPPTDPKGIAFDFFGQPRDPDPTYKKTPSRGNKGEFETMVLNMSSEKGVMLDHLHIQNMWTLNCLQIGVNPRYRYTCQLSFSQTNCLQQTNLRELLTPSPRQSSALMFNLHQSEKSQNNCWTDSTISAC